MPEKHCAIFSFIRGLSLTKGDELAKNKSKLPYHSEDVFKLHTILLLFLSLQYPLNCWNITLTPIYTY